MLCWVRVQDKEEIERVIKGIPLKFVNSLSDFENMITEDSYLIVSLNFSNEELKKLAEKFPNNVFNFYRLKTNENQTAAQTQLMGYKNITDGQYNADELRDNYLGIINDLWHHRLFENPTIVKCC